MAEIISLRFKREGRQYYFDPRGLQITPNTGLIVETSWGLEYGTCVRGNCEVSEAEIVSPLRPVIRIATAADQEVVYQNRLKEKRAYPICQEKIAEHKLDMKLVDVEYSFEGNKILFFFTSDGRVDFRALVKNLASIFHTRIELRQIGVRDEAMMIGGLGICGRPFCCATFLHEFQPVSIKMAKTQNLSLNPVKISGTCGRLMCCLKYEQDAYEDLLKGSPKADSFVETPDGVGVIISVNTLREQVRVRLDNAPDKLTIYHNSEISVVRSGKGKRPDNYEMPSPAELAKLRRIDPTEALRQDPIEPSITEFLTEEKPQRKAKKEKSPKQERPDPESTLKPTRPIRPVRTEKLGEMPMEKKPPQQWSRRPYYNRNKKPKDK
ncbi:MAG: stage 0 sporulation family protein [Evtepia sp.]